jgi:benzoyl-CoA reductase/2-hydroxyglutaryl-CoA dehydratase subunit BcrC/BadD/HgdB
MKRQINYDLWREEVFWLKGKIEETTGKKITAEKLLAAIKMINDRRRVLQRLNKLRRAIPAPISGRDALLINQISFYDDPRRFSKKINSLCDEVEERIKRKKGVVPAGTARLLLCGCPMAVPNWKLPYVIESSGAVIVDEESCIGERNTRDLVDETGTTVEEMLDNIVMRYMKIDCACFTPNTERIEHIISLAKQYQVDGIIHYTLQFCDPYLVEAHKVEKALEKEDIACLRVETDYSMEDIEQLKTRIEAFVEMIK